MEGKKALPEHAVFELDARKLVQQGLCEQKQEYDRCAGEDKVERQAGGVRGEERRGRNGLGGGENVASIHYPAVNNKY